MAEPLADQVRRRIGKQQAKVRKCLAAFDRLDGRVKTMKEVA